MKKLVSILLALAMILSLSICVLADEPETYTLTFNGIQGHTYHLYQIFVGNVSEEDGKPVLSDVKYGADYGTPDEEVPADLLKNFSSATPEELATMLGAVHFDTVYAVINEKGTENTVTIKDLPGGYYMIKDVTTAENMPDGQTESLVILQVLESVEITSKHATISSTKKVFDFNDSIDLGTEEHLPMDSADYDIGDDVPFQLTVKFPTTMPSYKDHYSLTFHDQQAAGLDPDINISAVYILKADNTTKINITPSTNGAPGYILHNDCINTEECELDNCTFCIEVLDINSFYTDPNTYADGDQLIVEYTAELLETANTGREGNINAMYVCHPDGHTPIDYVTVLTYELDITKVDGATGNDLLGAKFMLYKWIASENGNQGDWVEVGNELDGTTNATFVWKGLDDGKYKLVEKYTPENYNTIKDIIFVIEATHKDEWLPDGGNRAFLDVIAKNEAGNEVVFADKVGDVEDGILSGTVANHKGAVLPETGAEGTFFLITGGTLLVLVAAVFMITRKKMSIYED